MEGQWDEVTYELPTVNDLLDVGGIIYCTKEFCSFQHIPEKFMWICTIWGEFLSLEFD